MRGVSWERLKEAISIVTLVVMPTEKALIIGAQRQKRSVDHFDYVRIEGISKLLHLHGPTVQNGPVDVVHRLDGATGVTGVTGITDISRMFLQSLLVNSVFEPFKASRGLLLFTLSQPAFFEA